MRCSRITRDQGPRDCLVCGLCEWHCQCKDGPKILATPALPRQDRPRTMRALLDEFERLRAENADLRSRLEAAEGGLGINPQSAYLVFFDDPDHGHETFVGAGAREAAVARHDQASNHWSCSLFAQIRVSGSEIEHARHSLRMTVMKDDKQ